MQYTTVNNSIITLGSTDGLTSGRRFESRFLQPGLAGYPGQYGNALIRKESLDKFINTLINKPVIINHQSEIAEKDKAGEVLNVWFNPADGWYWCSGVIYDNEAGAQAQNLIKNRGWSVSCSYSYTKSAQGGTENNIPYDIEFLDGEFEHLAIVENPRYERANIVFNAKIDNFNPEQKRDEQGRWVKDDAVIQKKKDSIIPIEVKPEDVPQFKSKEDLGNWFKSIFKDLGSVTIEDTGIRIDLYEGNADREAFKRRFQQEPNKAAAKEFKDVVSKAIKVGEREKDEKHKHNQEIYYNKLKLGKDTYDVNLFVDYLAPNKEYRYAGHSTEKIENEISARDTQVINHIMLTKADITNSIIPENRENETPDVKEYDMEVNNGWVTLKDKEGEPYHVELDDKEEKIELDAEDWEYIAKQPADKQQPIIDALISKKRAEIASKRTADKNIEKQEKRFEKGRKERNKKIVEEYTEKENKRKNDAKILSFEDYFKKYYPQYKIKKKSPVYELAKGEWEEARTGNSRQLRLFNGKSVKELINNAIAQAIADKVLGEL